MAKTPNSHQFDPFQDEPRRPFDLPGDSIYRPSPLPGDDLFSFEDPFKSKSGSLPEDPFFDEYTSVGMPHRQEQQKPRESRGRLKRLGGVIAGVAVVAGGAAFALRGGGSGSEASARSTGAPVTTTIEHQPTDISPSTPETTSSAAVETTVAATLEKSAAAESDPFARTGDPTKDAVLAWFEQADQNTHVDVLNQEFAQPVTGGGLFDMVDRNETFKHEFQSQFEFAFQPSSGLQVNVYEAGVNGLPDVELDAKALAITMDYVLSHAREANTGYLNEDELTFMEQASSTGALTGMGVNLIILNRGEDCLEALDEHMMDADKTKCEVSGFTSVMYGGVQSKSVTIVVQLPPENWSAGIPHDADLKNEQSYVTQVIAHEFAHAMSEFSGANERHEAPIVEQAKQAATRPNGSVDNAIYGQLLQEGINRIGAEEHETFVNEIGDMAWKSARINTDVVYFKLPTQVGGKVELVDGQGPNVLFANEDRSPFTNPPVRINS